MRALAQLQPHRQDIAGIEAAVDLHQVPKACDHQPGAREQHHRKRYLRDDEGRLNAGAACPLPTSTLDRRTEIAARGSQRRRQPEQYGGQHRGEHGEAEHTGIDGQVVEPRHHEASDLSWHSRLREAIPVPGEHSAERGSAGSHQDALGEQLANDPAASGAQRHTHGDLATACGGPRQLDIGNGGAGECQEEARSPHQKGNKAVGTEVDLVAQRLHSCPTRRAGRRALLRETHRQIVELALGAGQCALRWQASHDPQARRVMAAPFSRVQAQGYPQIGSERIGDPAGHDSGHGHVAAVEAQCRAHDRLLTAEAAVPELEGDHGHVVGIRSGLVGTEHPASGELDSEHAEVRRRNRPGEEPFRLGVAGQHQSRRPVGRDPLEDVAVAPGTEVCGRCEGPGETTRRIGLPHKHQTADIGQWQRAQNECTDAAEDRRGGADPYRECGQRDQCRCRVATQSPGTESKVANDAFKPDQAAGLTMLGTHQRDTAEATCCRPPRLPHRHSGAPVLLRLSLQVEPNLLVELLIGTLGAKRSIQTPDEEAHHRCEPLHRHPSCQALLRMRSTASDERAQARTSLSSWRHPMAVSS